MNQPAQQQPAAQTEAASDFDVLKRGEYTERQRSITEGTAAFLGVPPDKVFGVLRGVWTTSKGQPALSDQELMVGMALVQRYGLDPFAREIYVTRDKKGRLMTIIGIDGFIRILDRTDHYDGFEQFDIKDGQGNLTGITTTIYSTKRSHPATYPATAAEYSKLGGFMAGQIPTHMLRLFSLKHAARLFVPLGTVVTAEEARVMGYQEAEPDATQSHADQARKLRDAGAGFVPDPPLNPPTPGEVAKHIEPTTLVVEAGDRAVAEDVVRATQHSVDDPPTGDNVATSTPDDMAEHAVDVPKFIHPTPDQQAEVADAMTRRVYAAVSASNLMQIESDIVKLIEAKRLNQTQAVKLSALIKTAREERIDYGNE